MKKKVTYNLPAELVDKLKKVSDQTMIPQSKLMEKALEGVLKEYDKR